MMRAELQVAGQAPVVIGAVPLAEDPDTPDGFPKNFEVIDVVQGPNELVVACVVGRYIGLWRINFSESPRGSAGWTFTTPDQRIAAPFALGKGLTKISMTPENKRWLMTIEYGQEKFRFEQTERWEFKQVEPKVSFPR